MLDQNENIKTLTHQLIIVKLIGKVRQRAEKLEVPNLPHNSQENCLKEILRKFAWMAKERLADVGSVTKKDIMQMNVQ